MTALIQSQSTTEICAGGLTPEKFDLQEVWYPIHYVDDLDKTKPTAFTLLGRDLVIWWDNAATTWRVFDDKCPHRLARLSEGRINEQGLIECPYHGWAFSGRGKCEIIPQQRQGQKAETSQRACVNSLPTLVRQGLLFTYPGNPENAPYVTVPIIETLEENAQDWVCIDTFRDLPYDAFTLLENVLDSSHVPFTHHGTVGNRANAAPVELEVVESDRQGFKGVWEEGPRRGTLGRQETIFIAPHFMCHDLTSKQFGRTLTVVYATPISKGKCRLFARFPFKFPSKIPSLVMKITPRWYSHLGQNAILEDDQIFLHHQERYLEQQGGSTNFNKSFYLPTKADAFVSEFRQWINEYQADPFPHEILAAPLSREQLLDRYFSHTIHCVSCSRALSLLKKWRLGLGITAVICWTISPLLSVLVDSVWAITVITAMSLISVWIWLWLGKLESRFYRGESIPSRNLQ